MDKQNANGYLTIGVLKNYIKDLSDDNKVVIEDDDHFVYATHVKFENGILKIF